MSKIITFNIETQEWEAPADTAAVDQDIEVTDFSKGVVLKSPDGSRWRVTMENDGTLTTTNLTPP
jgi:lipopolysaccharide export system protein LptC